MDNDYAQPGAAFPAKNTTFLTTFFLSSGVMLLMSRYLYIMQPIASMIVPSIKMHQKLTWMTPKMFKV